MSLRRRSGGQKSRLPGPLTLPKSYIPRYLSPMDEEVLARRLSRVPERWTEGYGRELRTPPLFVAKKVSKREVDKIVARLSASTKQEAKLAVEEEHDLFAFEETEEQSEERKLDAEEVERLVERLSQTSLRSETKSEETKEKSRPRVKLTDCEMQSLTERLSKPRKYVNPNANKGKLEGRFVGKKMNEGEIKAVVHRIAYKGMKVGRRGEKPTERDMSGYFAAWTSCDADFKEWRRTNRDILSQNERYYQYY